MIRCRLPDEGVRAADSESRRLIMSNKKSKWGFSITAIAVVILILGALPANSVTKNQVDTSSADQKAIAITIYNDGTGLVKDTRAIDFPEGEFDLKYMDVAASIDPTSVHFVCLSDPESMGIQEQNYEYDLVNTAALYKAHIDRGIKVRTSEGRIVEGTLLSADSGLVINTSDGIVIVASPIEVSFEELPEGLLTKPTLNWSLTSTKSGPQETEMSYLTSGMGWNANYVAVLGQNNDVLDLSGWVTIKNNSGTDYNDALLTLVAGKVHRVQPKRDYRPRKDGYIREGFRPPGGFEEESFFEYHLYTLQRPATVLNKEQKQIDLLEGEGVHYKKFYLVVNPNQVPDTGCPPLKFDVQTKLTFRNSEQNGLGMALPAGVIRVFQKDSSGELQFIGKDNIRHTPRDEDVEVNLGPAPDIVCYRNTNYKVMGGSFPFIYEVKLWIRNHKSEKVDVIYRDEITTRDVVMKNNFDYKQINSGQIEFVVPVEANSETVLTYFVDYCCR
jgi:hypothetical protein